MTKFFHVHATNRKHPIVERTFLVGDLLAGRKMKSPKNRKQALEFFNASEEAKYWEPFMVQETIQELI